MSRQRDRWLAWVTAVVLVVAGVYGVVNWHYEQLREARAMERLVCEFERPNGP